MHLPRATLAASLATVASLVLVPAAGANFAPRFWGDAAGEPLGLKNVAIVRERLTIDLRPLSDMNLVHVDVTYDLNNAGEWESFVLLFISGEAGVTDFEADLDGRPLRAWVQPANESRRLREQMPTSWRPPKEAPGIESEKTFYLFSSQGTPPALVAISLVLPPGPSRLHVYYRARACGAAERPTVTWQLPYVLAPARQWGGFGGLDVTVNLPSGWEARSAPALEREGDTLRGSFDGLPADALLLATASPVPPTYHWAIWFPEVLWAVLLLGGPLMCWWAGRRLGLAGAAGLRRLRRGLVPALVWGALIYASVPVSMDIIRITLHGQESPSFGEPWFAGPCLNFIIIPAAVFLGVTLTLGSASRVSSRSSADVPPTE